MQAKISVIVPVYQVEQYLAQCIESIVAQTHQNLEIIMVDDGSPDGCGAICDAWQKKDPRICVIHTQNAGLSCARNTGLAHATGDYIMFVDSDDYIAPQMAARLLQQIAIDQSDLAVCDWFILREIEPPNVIAALPKRASFDVCLDTAQALRLLGDLKPVYGHTTWNKLYAKKLFDTIRFPAGKIAEDVFVLHHIYAASVRISFLSDKLYYYRRREDSITTQPFSVRRLDAVEGLCQRAIFMQERGDYNAVASAIWHAHNVLGRAHRLLDQKDADVQLQIAAYEKQCRAIFFSCFWKKIEWKRRCAVMLYIIHPQLYYGVKEIAKWVLLRYRYLQLHLKKRRRYEREE